MCQTLPPTAFPPGSSTPKMGPAIAWDITPGTATPTRPFEKTMMPRLSTTPPPFVANRTMGLNAVGLPFVTA